MGSLYPPVPGDILSSKVRLLNASCTIAIIAAKHVPIGVRRCVIDAKPGNDAYALRLTEVKGLTHIGPSTDKYYDEYPVGVSVEELIKADEFFLIDDGLLLAKYQNAMRAESVYSQFLGYPTLLNRAKELYSTAVKVAMAAKKDAEREALKASFPCQGDHPLDY